MPFGMVSGVGRGMGVLDGSGDHRREGAVLGVNLGRPIVTNGAFVAQYCARAKRALLKLRTLRTCFFYYTAVHRTLN